jgi:lipopolysaccharide export system permease protein
LIKCLSSPTNYKTLNCAVDTKKEIVTVLNRRITLPFYIPIVALLCSFLLIKSQKKNSYIFNKYSIFGLSFFILLYSELIIRYTGISKFISTLFIISPFLLVPIVYFFLIFQFSKESLSK